MTDVPAPFIVRVAVDVPLRRTFDYLPAPHTPVTAHRPGCRVLAPFGRRTLIGVILELAGQSALPQDQLKPLSALLDADPQLSPAQLELGRWSADYYQHPIGEVLVQALPNALRQPEPPESARCRHWRLTGSADVSQLPRQAHRQRALLQTLSCHPSGLAENELREQGFSLDLLRKLEASGLIQCQERDSLDELPSLIGTEEPLPLNPDQRQCLQTLLKAPPGHQGFLLYGLTGSGKTEVYLQWIQHLVERQQQVLVLVPEISLTPQTLERFRRRFGQGVDAYHSGLTPRQRWETWERARRGTAHVVIGTRSAIFLGFARLGAIIVDEEHDASFKQQDGFRYSARDLAMVRGKLENIPVLLGSATPSLESLRNVDLGKYQLLRLNRRAGTASPARRELLDIKSRPLQAGLSTPLIERIRQHLTERQQVLVFINRRGFAPVLMCTDCGWFAECRHCDARLTLHRTAPHLRCHHCDATAAMPVRCPKCDGPSLRPLGTGTERTEDELQRLFPEYPVYRIDSDTTASRTRFASTLEQVHQGLPCILVGTQILAKGHHFPQVTLVAVLNADSGLFSSDFRATERMTQTLVQVAGRAGRDKVPGSVVIQTHHADHPLLQCIAGQDYLDIAHQLLNERAQAALPPFQALTLLIAEARTQEQALGWLQSKRRDAQRLAQTLGLPDISLAGPMPAIMERRADRYRAQFHLSSPHRGQLRRLTAHLVHQIEMEKTPPGLRWSLDVDPVDLL